MEDLKKWGLTIESEGKRRDYCVMFDEAIYSLEVKKVIANDNAVIVFFDDGRKKVMRCTKGDKYDIETAVAFAIAQKAYGSNSAFKKSVAKVLVDCREKQKN